MEGAAKFYLACLGLAVLFFAMFPAHDTIVNPVKVMPLETRVERVIETESDDLVQITQYIVEVEDRVEAVEQADDTRRTRADEMDRRIRLVAESADEAVKQADALREKVAAVEETQAREKRDRQAVTWTLFGAFVLIYLTACVHILRSRYRCNKTTSGTPTSAGTPTKR